LKSYGKISILLLFATAVSGALLLTLLFAKEKSCDKKFYKFRIRGKNYRFEPSAVSKADKGSNFIVFNDKNDKLPISLFELDKSDVNFSEVKTLSLKKDAQTIPHKFEASTKRGNFFYAVTAFDRDLDEYRKIIMFKLNSSNEIKLLSDLKFDIPPRVILKKKWLKIEALSISPDGNHLLFGIRATGEDYKDPHYGVTILKYSLPKKGKNILKLTEGNPIANFDISSHPNLKRAEGISSLEYVEDRKLFLLLTSYEADSGNENESRKEVGGHLWILPEDKFLSLSIKKVKEITPKPFSHKPEGVETLSKNKALILFDDDNDRKKGENSATGFKLRKNESVFKIVEF